MEGLTLDELIAELRNMRQSLGRGDIQVLYSVNAAEYEGRFQRVVTVDDRDAVFLDDGSMIYADYSVIREA